MIVALWAALALAQPLGLDEVLAAVDARVPQLEAALSRIDEAEGRLLAGRGAFDPRLRGAAWTYDGVTPYARYAADASFGVTTALGPSVEVGWRVGQGTFPAYDGYYETLPVGRARVQVAVPLLDGLGLGAERARLLVAEFGVAGATRGADGQRLALQRRAAEAWWDWVGAGARLEVARSLLDLAEQRQAALARQVELGTLASLDALDHERVVQRRRADLLDAQRALDVAARRLSLWYRDDGGAPVVPDEARLASLPASLGPLPDIDGVARALDARPELAVIDVLLAQAGIERRRALNERLPTFDVVARVEQSPEDPRRAEVYVGAKLEVPLLQRKGRGEQARASAAIDRLEAERRALTDQITVEVEASALRREAAAAQAEALAIAADRAREAAALEQRAFDLGASDLFRVLVREQTYAEAVRDAIAARVEVGLADAAWRAAADAF